MKIESGYQKYQFAKSASSVNTTKIAEHKQADVKSVDLSFSETAQNLQKSTKSLETSSMNTEKIAALKAAINNGTYKVDPDDLAKAMLNSEK